MVGGKIKSPKRRYLLVVLFFIVMFTSLPLVLIVAFVSTLGVTSLSCQHIEPAPINCELQRSKYFGLVQTPPTILRQVSAAHFESQEEVNKHHTSSINFVALSSRTGKVTAFENPATPSLGAAEMQAIATQINEFIQSKQPTLLIRRDIRWRWGLSIFPLTLISLITVIVYFLLLTGVRVICFIQKNPG